jgi:hypothetical protein
VIDLDRSYMQKGIGKLVKILEARWDYSMAFCAEVLGVSRPPGLVGVNAEGKRIAATRARSGQLSGFVDVAGSFRLLGHCCRWSWLRRRLLKLKNDGGADLPLSCPALDFGASTSAKAQATTKF